MISQTSVYIYYACIRINNNIFHFFLPFSVIGPVVDLLERQRYVSSYDRRNRVPHWVGEHVTADSLKVGENVDRDKSSFKEDTDIPEIFRALLADYSKSGYDRGHMAPAADAVSTQDAMDETFLLTNMSPQVGNGFNRHCKFITPFLFVSFSKY